ncbi:MAG TPA: phosphate ABC transporter permease PstA, partial [Bacillota bacterium]
LEEYARPGRLRTLIETNISNLAGVPSIVYGILGLVVFVRFAYLGRSLLAGALTLALLVLPLVTVAAQEAIRAVPRHWREAAYAMGASRWQVVRGVVLPAALPGILTGTILAVGRMLGETAPLVVVGALTYVAFLPQGPLDGFTAMPVQIFSWTTRPREEFHALAAAGIVVMLIVLLAVNALAIGLRDRYQHRVEE